MEFDQPYICYATPEGLRWGQWVGDEADGAVRIVTDTGVEQIIAPEHVVQRFEPRRAAPMVALSRTETDAQILRQIIPPSLDLGPSDAIQSP